MIKIFYDEKKNIVTVGYEVNVNAREETELEIQIVEIRPEGETTTYWTLLGAVEE